MAKTKLIGAITKIAISFLKKLRGKRRAKRDAEAEEARLRARVNSLQEELRDIGEK